MQQAYATATEKYNLVDGMYWQGYSNEKDGMKGRFYPFEFCPLDRGT